MDMPFLPPRLPRAQPVGRELYAALRRAVIMGEIRPGNALSETQIATRLEISRTPVREVFRRLADEGFLRVLPQVGTFVSPISLQAVYDGQFVRETLERRTVRLAAERRKDGDAEELMHCLARQRQAIADGDLPAFFLADDALHDTLMRMAGRPAIWKLIQDVKAHMDRVRYLSLEQGDWLSMIFDQHEEIVDRVIEGDERQSEAAMEAHLRTVFGAIKRLARENPAFFDDDAVTLADDLRS